MKRVFINKLNNVELGYAVLRSCVPLKQDARCNYAR